MTEKTETEIREFFATCLRVALAKKGKNQYWLSKNTGKSREFINQICNGKRSPSVGTINEFCNALDMSMSEFVKGGE